MALPGNIGFGTVTGKFMQAMVDGSDGGREPEGTPIAGMSIVFTPSITLARSLSANTIIALRSFPAVTDSTGTLIGPDGLPGIMLLATDDVDMDPSGWTWRADITGSGVSMSFSFSLPEGSTLDLASIVAVPSSNGSTISDAFVRTIIADSLIEGTNITFLQVEGGTVINSTNDTAALELALQSKANDSEVVKTEGAQDVNGVKNFLDGIVVPSQSIAMDKVSGLDDALDGKANLVGGVLASSELPPIAGIGSTFYVNSQAAMLALSSAVKDDQAVRTDFTPARIFLLSNNTPGTLGSWIETGGAGTVTSVNGQVGSVVLSKANVGLGNVSDLTPANMPISTAQATVNSNQATLNSSQSTLNGTFAPKASPALTGVPTSPTAALGTTTTQIASTEFVQNQADAFQAALPEYIYDQVADILVGSASVVISPNDTTNKISFTATGGSGGGSTPSEVLHAAIPTNNSTDCGPAIQAICDAGYELNLTRGVTYYINTPVFADQVSLQNPFVINMNGATFRLGTGLPLVTNVLDGAVRFAFLPNLKRTSWAGGSASITISEAQRATGSSGKYTGMIVRDGRWTTSNAANTGLVCATTCAVKLDSVHQEGGRTSLTWWGYTEPHTLNMCTITSMGGANQIADAWFLYGESEGDGITVTGMKSSGAVGGISLEGCHGASINGVISARIRLIKCNSILIGGLHNESMMTTYPGNVMIRSSDVTFESCIFYMTRPEMKDLTMTEAEGMICISDTHNEMSSNVTMQNCTTGYFQRSPYITDPLDPPLFFDYVNPNTVVKVKNQKSLLISIGSPGVWRRTSAPFAESRVSAAGLSTPYAKTLIASGDFQIVNTVLTYASNGSPANMKIITQKSGEVVARRALAPCSGLALYADNGVGTGGLGVSGTTYYYTVAFRNAAGQYTQYNTPVSRATDADRTMRLRIENPNNDSVAVIWRKNGSGVESTPDWYTEIPLSSPVTWLLDMGPHIGGWLWQAGAGRIPTTVAATNQTVRGMLVDEVAI
jgi:hypothetical protein